MATATMDPKVQKAPEAPQISLAEIEKMSIEERNKNLDSGKFDAYMNSKDPEVKKQFNESFIKKPVANAPDPETKAPEAVKPPEKPAEVKPVETKPAEAAKPEEKKPAETTVDEWDGFGSKEAYMEATREARRLATKYKKTLDEKNAADGQLGKKVKEYQEQLEREKREKEELRKKLNEHESKVRKERMSAPEMPEEVKNALGEDFAKKTLDFNNKLLETQDLTQAQINELRETNLKLQQRIEENNAKEAEREKEREERRIREEQEAYQKSLKNLYDDADSLQKKYAEFKTSRSFGDLNEEILAHTDPTTGKCDPDFLKTIAPADLKVFVNIKNLIENGYGEFGPEGFKRNPAFKNLNQRYLLHLEETGQLEKTIAERELAAKRAAAEELRTGINQRQETATTIPDTKTGSVGSTGIADNGDKNARIDVLLTKSEKGTITADEDKELDQLLTETGKGGAVPKPKKLRS